MKSNLQLDLKAVLLGINIGIIHWIVVIRQLINQLILMKIKNVRTST